MKYLKTYKIFENLGHEFVNNFIDLMNSLSDDENYKPLIKYYKETDNEDGNWDQHGWKDELYFPIEDLGNIQIIFSNKDGKYNDLDQSSAIYLKEYYIDRIYDMIPYNYQVILWVNYVSSSSRREKVTLSELETIINDGYPEISRIEL